MLVDGGCEETLTGLITYSRQLSQARPRTASTSLSLRPLHEGAATARWRSSKTRQTRIQFRHTPGEFGLTVYLRDLRDPSKERLRCAGRPHAARSTTVTKP